MLKNYIRLGTGVIKQVKLNKKITYDKQYIIDRYDSYGALGPQMAYLRLGYILGTLKQKPTTILDVGYGNGDFLRACLNSIKHCYGNDVSGYDLPEGVNFVDDILAGAYDVITFFDVLEHFEDINFVSKLNAKFIVVSVPWCHYKSDKWFEGWKHRREDEHLYHFSAEALISFFERSGFRVLNYCDIEDCIRKGHTELPNILTATFQKVGL